MDLKDHEVMLVCFIELSCIEVHICILELLQTDISEKLRRLKLQSAIQDLHKRWMIREEMVLQSDQRLRFERFSLPIDVILHVNVICEDILLATWYTIRVFNCDEIDRHLVAITSARSIEGQSCQRYLSFEKHKVITLNRSEVVVNVNLLLKRKRKSKFPYSTHCRVFFFKLILLSMVFTFNREFSFRVCFNEDIDI
jgi:hypothetical protein